MKLKMQDDLTAVKGIGPARQRWLGDLFNVHSFEALARLSVEVVEQKAKDVGKILAKGEVASWIAQAKTLAAAKDDLSKIEVEVAEPKERKTAVSIATTSWKPIASFVVEFQENAESGQRQRRTKVHHMEADKEITWPGIEREQLGLWLEEHVQVSEPTEKLVETKPVFEKVKAIKPTRVRVRQQPDYMSTLDLIDPERPFLGHVRHEEPILLEVDFKLDPPVTDQTWQPQTAYNVQCEVHNLTGVPKTYYLDMEGDFSPNRLTYRTKLSKVDPGMYRLALLLRGKRPLGATYFELPKLNVL